jgi:hypothetical protein
VYRLIFFSYAIAFNEIRICIGKDRDYLVLNQQAVELVNGGIVLEGGREKNSWIKRIIKLELN